MYKIFLFYFSLLIACNVFAQIKNTKLQVGKHIGILSIFPEKSGMFYDNRALLVDNKRVISIFPKKDLEFNFSVNDEIVNVLLKNLQFKYNKQYKFIPLPSFVSIENHLTGYAIEGWWGPETNSVSIQGLKHFFQSYKLDSIIAIAPVTYYLPPISGEVKGMNLSFVKNTLYFSATYAVLVFAKSSNSYKKIYSSIKQVYFASKNDFPQLEGKRYGQEHIKLYHDLFQSNFLPHISGQVVKFLEDGSSYSIFTRPKKPLHYYLPH